MSERTEYAPGTPSWADNASADPAKAAKFYSQLFGWETVDRMPPEADGEYHVASLRGKDVAALGSQPMEGVPAVWNTYVTVEDVEATAEKVKEAGGTVMMEPFDVFDAGRMAVFADPSGAVFMAWKANQMIGAYIVNEPNTMSWNELATRDVEGSKEFYGKVFDWQTNDMEFGGSTYTVWSLPGVEVGQGNGIGGMMEMNEQFPADAAAALARLLRGRGRRRHRRQGRRAGWDRDRRAVRRRGRGPDRRARRSERGGVRGDDPGLGRRGRRELTPERTRGGARRRPSELRKACGLLDGAHVGRARALVALLGVELHLGAIGEGGAALDLALVNEQVPSSLIGSDEAKPLLVVEPLNCAYGHCPSRELGCSRYERSREGRLELLRTFNVAKA